ncbi:Hypothetical predicted protein, partial [Pelobates cultripes]
MRRATSCPDFGSEEPLTQIYKQTNSIIDDTLRVWCKLRYARQLTTSPNPLTPITYNPGLAGGLHPAALKRFHTTDWNYMHQWSVG